MVTLVKLLQETNVPNSIEVIPTGMDMLVKLLQPANAAIPISVTPGGMAMLVKLRAPISRRESVCAGLLKYRL
jgi:hypothetical protein